MGKVCKILDKCIGCGQCTKACPTGAIRVVDKKAVIDETCVGCAICLRTCKVDAVVLEDRCGETAICNACPIHCSIPEGQTGACLRFINSGGVLRRKEPLRIVDKSCIHFDTVTGLPSAPLMLGLGAGSNLYSADIPARYIGLDTVDGVEIVTAVTEAVLSFSGAKVKLDTDEEIGPAGSAVKREGKVVGYIAPSEYGSRMLYIGGSELVTGPDGFAVAKTMIDLLNKKAVTLRTEAVKELVIQQGKPPIVDGKRPLKMRVGCGSMIVEGFAKQWMDICVDEVIACDFDIMAALSTHTTCGVRYGMRPSGIIPVGTYSSPGRYFGTAGSGWGGSDVMCARDAIAYVEKTVARPGARLVVTETNAERAGYFELDENLDPVEKPIPEDVERVLQFIRDNCENCCTNVTAVACIGGGVRNVLSAQGPLKVNQALWDKKIMFSICGQPGHVLPGGGITVESSVADMPENAFAWVATPATVFPIEMTTTLENYEKMGGYMEAVRPVADIVRSTDTETVKL